jgi:hypothetical protein
MKYFLFFLLALGLNSFSYAANYENVDNFKQSVHAETGTWGGFKGENELEGGLFLSLVPGKTTFKNNESVYKLKIRWTGPELLLVDHAQLILLIDGERVVLNPSQTFSQHLIDTQITSNNNDIYERVDYDVEKNLIEKIAHAKNVECALYTPRGRIERHLDKGNQKQFKEFIKNF